MPKDQFKFKLEKLGKSKRTVTEYNARFRDFYAYLVNDLHKFDAFEVTTVDVISYKEHLLRKNQTINTINGKLNSISLFYKLAKLDGLIEENPVPKGVYIYDEAPDFPLLTYKQEETLKAWMDGIATEIGTAFWIMYGAGLRSGEVANLKRNNIFFSFQRVYVHVIAADHCKNRIIPVLNEEAANRIKTYVDLFKGNYEDNLFTITKKLIHHHAQAFMNITGIQLYSHIFRYMIAKHLRNNNIPEAFISMYLGEWPKGIKYGDERVELLCMKLIDIIDPIAPKLQSLEEV